MLGYAIVGTVTVALVGWRVWRKRRLMAEIGADFAAYNAAAYKTQFRPADDDRFTVVERLASEMQSKAGQLAVLVESQGRALHHINKDGTFSKKGPYFVSRHTHNWKVTGRKHLIRSIVGKGSWGFESSNPGQRGGGIRERGIAVLEYDTPRYPPVDIWGYEHIHKRRATLNSLIDP